MIRDRIVSIWRFTKFSFKVGMALLAGIILAGVGIGVLSYSGYCFRDTRFLSDEEKINTAIGFVLEYQEHLKLRRGAYRDNTIDTPDIHRSFGDTPKNPIYYRDIAEFRRINPKCCSLTHTHPYMGSLGLYEFLDRLFGEKSTYVKIVYQAKYRDADGKEKIRFIQEGVAIKNCGEPWYGMPN